MKKRIAIIGLYHESNTFSSVPTEWVNFAAGHLFLGNEIIERYQHAHHEIGGFLEGIQSHDVEVVPMFFADALPSGKITKSAYQRLEDELLNALQPHLPLDAVYAAAHGAAVSEEVRDVDGQWLKKLRDAVGQRVPIVGSLDPHANVSKKMVDSTDGFIAYATNPHLDQRQTGKRVADLLLRMMFNPIELKHELIQFPASLSIEQQETNVEPCSSFYKEVEQLLDKKEILTHSILLGFPYADVEEMGTSLVLVSEKMFDTSGLKTEVNQCAQRFYPQFTGNKLPVETVLKAKDHYEKPVLLLDMGDNVGGGALGNTSYLLDAIEAFGLSKACICMYNPSLVSQVSEAKIGEWMEIQLSNSEGPYFREPDRVQVLEKKSGRFFETAPRHGGQVEYDMGTVALVRTALGNFVVLTSLRVPPFSSEQLRIFDLDLTSLDWIIAKGVNAPIAAYRDICPVQLKIHTPGECNADATQLEYQFRRKPMIPFETIN